MHRSSHHRRSGNRTQIACVNCKEKKLKCDNKIPECENCRRSGIACLVEDPATRRHQPRNYVDVLEQRVAYLEGVLRQYRPELAGDHLVLNSSPRPEPPSTSPFPRQTSSNVASEQPNPGRTEGIDDEPENLNDLASKVGLLSLNAAGAEPHYLGSSSTFAFSRLIAASLRHGVSTPASASHDSHIDRRAGGDFAIHSGAYQLPHFEAALQLSNAYFENIHPQYPFLHEPTFRAWEATSLSHLPELEALPSDPTPLFFLNMVYAIGALVLPTTGYSAEQLYVSAQMYAEPILARNNYEAVQVILCCAVYSLRSSIGTSHWKLAGLALRQCIDLGYHRRLAGRRSSDIDLLRLELRKRIFWCAFSMDSQSSIMLGRPQGIPYQEIDAEFPMDVENSSVTEGGIFGLPHDSSLGDSPTTMARAIHHFRIRKLMSRIHSALYSDITIFDPADETYRVQVAQFRTEVDNWLASAPTVPSKGDELSLFATSAWFDLEYNYVILQLYRRQITHRQTDPTDPALLICLQAAQSMCQTYRRLYLQRSMTCTWAALHEIFLAGLTYLHCIWTSPMARETHMQGQIHSTCGNCTIVLVIMAERWPEAATYRDIFETLANRTMAMIDQKKPLTPHPLDTATEPTNLSGGDMAEQMTLINDVSMPEGFDEFIMSLVGDSHPQWLLGDDQM